MGPYAPGSCGLLIRGLWVRVPRGPLDLTAERGGPGDSMAVTELRQFEDRGHSLTVDSGWREVADAVLAWLKEHGL